MTETQLKILELCQPVFCSDQYEYRFESDTWPNIHDDRMMNWIMEEMVDYKMIELYDEEENIKYFSIFYGEN
jgi:hypothetical protein